MSPRFPTRSASLSRRIRSSSSVDCTIPFSWSLFILAVFTVAVWSCGVALPQAQRYFSTHTCSLKICDQSAQPASIQDLLLTQQQAAALTRANEQAIRLIREREASHAHGSSNTAQGGSSTGATAQQGDSSIAAQLLGLVLLTTFTGVGQRSSEAAAADNAYSYTRVISL
jgi:hypothetical protein